MAQKLEFRLLNYFTLIVLAASVIGIEFFIEINSSYYLSEINSLSSIQNDSLNSSLSNLRNKIIIMLGLLTVVVAIIMMMFVKNIALPLKKMAEAARKINEGDLTEVIAIENNDEIGLVGTAINELTSNLQETAAVTSLTTNQALQSLKKIEERIKNEKIPGTDDINDLKYQLETLNSFVETFKLLQTDIHK